MNIFNATNRFNVSLKRRNAFTLAEVLITLGIIGVVAAMTIPTLMAKYQKRSNALRWRKAYAEIAQAVKLMYEDEVVPASYSDNDVQNQNDFEYKLITQLSKYLKTSAVCHSNMYVEEHCAPKAYPGYTYDGSAWISNLGRWGAGASCLSLLNGELMCMDANIILVDVNGYSKPNKIGHDIFFATFDTDNYILRPAIGYLKGYGAVDGVTLKSTKGDGKSCSNNDMGYGCSYFYIHNLP